MSESQQDDPVSQHQTSLADLTDSPAIASHRVVYCTSCGIQLNGLRIGEPCPRCAAPVGSAAGGGKSSGKAIASLVLGIASLVGCMFYGLPGIVCGILAIVFGKQAQAEVQANRASPASQGMATAGRITGIVGLCLSVLMILAVIVWLYVAFFILMPKQQQMQQTQPPALPTQPALPPTPPLPPAPSTPTSP